MAKTRIGLLAASLILFLILGGWWALPRAVGVLPGGVQARLPERVLALASTPLPTALPAPERRTSPIAVVIPTLPPTPTSTIKPTGRPNLAQIPIPEMTPTVGRSATATPTATATQPAPPRLSQIEGMQIIAQKFNNCGPANLSMVLSYFGHAVDQLAIGDQLKPNYDDRNVSPGELVNYVEQHTTLQAASYSGGDLTTLKRLLAAGYPVIVEKGLHPSEYQGWMGHYLTLSGYDDGEEVFLSMDTFLGPWDGSGRLEPYDSLATWWFHFNNTFVVVYPPEKAAEVATILGPDFLEPVRMWQAAALMAQAVAADEPENAYAWFNLGTSLTQLGQLTGRADFYNNAAVAYDRAREIGLPWRMLWYQFGPYVAYLATGRFDDVLTLSGAMLSGGGGQNVEETYLYQGHALAALGNLDAATAAYRRALSLNPNLTAAQEALDLVQSVSIHPQELEPG